MSTSSMHVAKTGLNAQQTRMQIIANNLANVNTTGFKRDRANFETLLYQVRRTAGDQVTAEANLTSSFSVGTGARIVNSSTQSTHSVEVQVDTLDGFSDHHLTGITHGLLKIDVEGHEWEVLSGAKQCIRQFHFVICETRFDLEKGNASEIVEWMNSNGFRWIDCAAISGHKNSGRAKLSDLVFERLEGK